MSSRAVHFAAIVFTLATSTWACPKNFTWFSYSGQLFGIANNAGEADYFTAYNCCSSLGAGVSLSMPHSVDSGGLMMYIHKLFGGGAKEVWVDARRDEDNGTLPFYAAGQPFLWRDGSAVNSSLWFRGEPQHGEQCARLKVKTQKLHGRKCSASHTIFCQGIPLPDGFNRTYDMIWTTLEGHVYGWSVETADFKEAHKFCETYGEGFRLAVFDDVTTFEVITQALQRHVDRKSGFWVDASRPDFDVNAAFVWSNGQEVAPELWRTNDTSSSSSGRSRGSRVGGVAAALEMGPGLPKLTAARPWTARLHVLCQQVHEPVSRIQGGTMTSMQGDVIQTSIHSATDTVSHLSATSTSGALEPSATVTTVDTAVAEFQNSGTNADLISRQSDSSVRMVSVLRGPDKAYTFMGSSADSSTAFIPDLDDSSSNGASFYSLHSSWYALKTFPAALYSPTHAVSSTDILRGMEPASPDPFQLSAYDLPTTAVVSTSAWTVSNDQVAELGNTVSTAYISAITGTPLFLESSMHTVEASDCSGVGQTVTSGWHAPSAVRSVTGEDDDMPILSHHCSMCCASARASGAHTKEPTQRKNWADGLRNHSTVNITELSSQLRSIRDHLTVNVTNLTKTLRKKRSAPDSRNSACVMGIVGLVLLGVMFALIILADLKCDAKTRKRDDALSPELPVTSKAQRQQE